MATNNNTQKQLIKTLTETHQDPATAYKMAIKQATTREQAEQVKRIAATLKVKL